MKAILRREFSSYFQNVIGWLYIAATLALYGLYYYAYNLNYGYAKISYSLSAITLLLLITVPLLTMRSMSEEQKSKTDQLMLTSPVSIGKIVLAKYVAMAAVHTIALLIIALTPLFLMAFGKVPVAETYVAVLGFWLYGMVCIAIGLFLSSLTESQVISAVLTFAMLFLGYMMSSVTGLISSTGNIVTKILNCYNLMAPLDTFMNGCLSLTGIVYYVTMSALFLFLTTQSIQKRRWSISTKKLKTGVFSLGFVVVAIVLTVIVNLFANEIPSTYTAIDVTSSKLYSLTDDTKDYLKELKKDVTIYVIASEKNIDATVLETLKRYEDSSPHIKVEYKDPAVNPNFYQQYTDGNISMGSLIVTCGEISKVIDYSELFETTVDYTTYSQQTTGYDGEGQITSALQYVTSDNMPVIYEIEGHGEAAVSGNFRTVIEKSNVTLKSLNLLEEESIPKDAQALIINAPTADFSKDDAGKVIDYMQGGGNVFVTTSYQEGTEMTNFYSILEEYGINVIDGLVAEGDSNHYYQNPYFLLPEVASTEYTASVGNNYIFTPYAQGFTYAEDSDTITCTALLTTSESAVAKANISSENLEYEEGDTKGPLALAVAAAKTIDEETAGQMVVFGSGMLFTDEADSMVAGSNSGMFADIVSKFVNTDGIVSVVIPAKSYEVSQLTIAASFTVVFGLTIMILIPVLLLAAGIFIWAKRRKK